MRHWEQHLRGMDAARADQLVRHLFGDDGTVELLVTVSDKSGIKAYGFAFDGVAVPMSGGKGKFHAPLNDEKLLEWVMVGDPGGSMKVVVTRDGNAVAQRDKSTIPPPDAKAYDALKIKVS